jgi:hypothetical protein
MARPMPREPPVTITTLSLSSTSFSFYGSTLRRVTRRERLDVTARYQRG